MRLPEQNNSKQCFNDFISLEFHQSKKPHLSIIKHQKISFKYHLLPRILTDYHLKSTNSLERDYMRNIFQASFKLEKYLSSIIQA